MAATIKDIAKRLNISISTVSYALNNGPRPVPKEVRDQVLAVARELNYRPNGLARSMVTKRSQAIGIIPYAATTDLILSPFTQFVMNGILNEARRQAQSVVIFTANEGEDRAARVNKILDGRIDGVIFVAADDQADLLLDLETHNFPHVLVATGQESSAPRFHTDNFAGTEMAMNYLMRLGHKRIAHLAAADTQSDGKERRAAFTEFALRHADRIEKTWIVEGHFTQNSGEQKAIELLTIPDGPTAVFCANDEMAIGVLRAAARLEIAVPDELSVVGFDDAPYASVCYPSLTTVHQPLQEIGMAAMAGLMDLIEGRREVSSLSFPPRLIVRDSTTRPTEDQYL